MSVIVYGDQEKLALLTYPDLALNCKCNEHYKKYHQRNGYLWLLNIVVTIPDPAGTLGACENVWLLYMCKFYNSTVGMAKLR